MYEDESGILSLVIKIHRVNNHLSANTYKPALSWL